MITPNGLVRLLNVPLDKTQQNQIRFTSRSVQTAYFSALAVHQYQDVTFTRKDSMIKVPAHIDKLWNVNYVMYNNIDQGSRWFYAFITRMEWLSENSTAVYVKTDVYQTWMLDCEFRRSFTIREHVADDTIGLHTYPEGLETGDPLKVSVTHWSELDDLAIVVMVSEALVGGTWQQVAGHWANGIYTAVGMRVFTNISDCNNFIANYNETTGKTQALLSVFMVPQALLPAGWSNDAPLPSTTLAPICCKTITVSNTDINGYVPKNNKLFCWPYNFLRATNNQGQAADYKLELFPSSAIAFSAKAAIGPGMKVYMFPQHYDHDDTLIGFNTEFGLTLPPYPICGWLTDVWKQYVANGAMSAMVSGASSALSIASAAFTGQPMGVASGIIGAGSQLTEVFQKYMAAPQVSGNVNNTEALISAQLNHFEFYQVQIRAEYAAIIDEYFSMYGYKVNRVKVPEQASRPVWNFIQTSGANIIGDVPQDDLQELRGLFDKGITLWHNGDNVANYSLDNSVEV